MKHTPALILLCALMSGCSSTENSVAGNVSLNETQSAEDKQAVSKRHDRIKHLDAANHRVLNGTNHFNRTRNNTMNNGDE